MNSKTPDLMPETITRKTPVAHVDVLKISMEIAAKIDIFDADSVFKANAEINKALAPLLESRNFGKLKDERKLGRVAGDKF